MFRIRPARGLHDRTRERVSVFLESRRRLAPARLPWLIPQVRELAETFHTNEGAHTMLDILDHTGLAASFGVIARSRGLLL